MYKDDISDELMKSMEQALKVNSVEKQFGFNRIAHAADLLHTAADIFDAADMTDEADDITEILSSLLNDIK